MNSKPRRGASPRRVPPARADRFGTLGIWVAVVALIVFLPDAFTRWFLPKELLLLVALVGASIAPSRGRMPRPLWVLIGAGSLLLIAAATVSDNPLGALMGRWPRYEGLVALPVYVAAVWIGARLLGPVASPQRIGSFSKALLAASLLLGGVSVLEAAGLRPIAGDSDRPGALLGNATDQGLIGAALAVLLIPALLTAIRATRADLVTGGWLRLSGRQRRDVLTWPVMLALGVGASIASVIISVSRAGLLALGAGLLVVIVLTVVRRARTEGTRAGWRAAAGGAGGALVLAAAVFAIPSFRARLLGRSDFALRTIEDRLAIWQSTAAMVAEHPVLGVGPSGFLDAVVVRQDATWYRSVGPGTVLDSPHNWVLQAAAAGGIPLLAVAVLLALVVTVVSVRRLRVAAPVGVSGGGAARFDLLLGSLAAVIGLGAGLLTHFTGAATGILLGLLIGVLTAVAPTPERMPWRGIRTALFAVWLVAFALLTAAEVPLAAGMRAATAAEAHQEFDEAQALRPWDADLTSIAAQTLTARADSGDPGAAHAAVLWAERAATALPGNLAAQYTLGVALRASGDVDGAVRQFESLHRRYPEEPRVRMQLGVTLVVAGDHAAGLRHLEKAQALSPDDESIRRMLAWADSIDR